MVKELLTADRVNLIPHAKDWQDAIVRAAQPLLQDGSITQAYVDGMLQNVLQNGSYIVLTDGFALPHAQGNGIVSHVSLSLLQVDEPVDLLGKPVKVFLVLATPDNCSHIQALAQLMDLLYNTDNMNLLKTGTKEQILELISTI